jgi:hypothetical protein
VLDFAHVKLLEAQIEAFWWCSGHTLGTGYRK